MEIFVFGSNLAGRHGKGAALWARQHRGAIYGQCCGLQGQSYGIPTKDYNIQTLPLEDIKPHVEGFVRFAKNHPELTFKLTAVGTGLANHKAKDIAPMFFCIPRNVFIPMVWQGFYPGHPFWEGETTEAYDKSAKAIPTEVALDTCPACKQPGVPPESNRPFKFCLRCGWSDYPLFRKASGMDEETVLKTAAP